MFVDISLDFVVSQRPLCGTLLRVPRPLSLLFPYSRRVRIVLRWSLYGAVSDGYIFGHFIPFLPAVLIGYTQGANISLQAGFGKILILSAVFVMFHSRCQSTLIPIPPSIRLM